MGRALWVWGPALAMMAALFVSSSGATVTLPGRFDLVAHLGAYTVLGLLSIRACAGARWRGVRPSTLAGGWLLTVAYGAVDEWHQSFVAGRFPAIDDWVADAVGAALAVAAAAVGARLVARMRRGREV